MAQRNSRRRSRVVIALQVVAAVNVVAGAAYLTVRTVARESAGTPSESNGKRDLARAARASGLAELERGDFRQAVSSFNRAIELGGPSPEVNELLRIATDLRDRGASTATATRANEKVAADAEPPKELEPTKSETASTDSGLKSALDRGAPDKNSHTTPKDMKKHKVTASPPRPTKHEHEDVDERGTVIVTSTPSGLNTVLDGTTVGATPIRFTADTGRHTLELYSGRTSVYSKEITVLTGRIVSLDPEIEVSTPTPTPTLAPTPTPTPAPTPTSQPTVVTPPPSQPTQPVERPAPRAPESPAEVKPGGLVLLANASVAGTRVSTSELKGAFSGEKTTINGSNVVLVMRPLGSSASSALLSRIGMQQRQFKDQWNKLQYYGGRTPPHTIASLADVVHFIANTPGAVCPLTTSDLDELPPNTLKRIPVN